MSVQDPLEVVDGNTRGDSGLLRSLRSVQGAGAVLDREPVGHAASAPSDVVRLPSGDVLPKVAEADLVKLDIEGGEWVLLADERFVAVRALELGYHRDGCPGADPAVAAHELLRGHGLQASPLFEAPAGGGMLRATRPTAEEG